MNNVDVKLIQDVIIDFVYDLQNGEKAASGEAKKFVEILLNDSVNTLLIKRLKSLGFQVDGRTKNLTKRAQDVLIARSFLSWNDSFTALGLTKKGSQHYLDGKSFEDNFNSQQSVRQTKIVSVCSVIIAVAAVFISFWSGINSKKHSKLSVTPVLKISAEQRDVKDYNGIYLNNSGLGPAMIEEIVLEYNGVNYHPHSEYSLDSLFGVLELENYEFFVIERGTYLSVGMRQPLFQVSTKVTTKLDSFKLEYFNTKITDIDVEVKYQSIYGDTFTEKWGDH